MQNFVVNLESEVFNTFRCIKAAQSQDIDVVKKSKHTKTIACDITTPFNIGVIYGASGSGKTTLARQMFGDKFNENEILDPEKAIIDQFPNSMTYDDCQTHLSAVGLTSVPCWIRPVKTLSNGQKFRATVAVLCTQTDSDLIVIDEWTSVVDRTIAKIMSHSIQKYARKFNKKIVLLSCHNDVFDWLLPDWIIDCNLDTYDDRRLLRQVRAEQLSFDIAEADPKTWKNFSKYHYLSERLPGGKVYHFGLYDNGNQIGYMCFANYTIGKQNILHSNRVVLHPDYCGINIANQFVDVCCQAMYEKGFKIMAKNSSKPRYKQLSKNPKWRLVDKGILNNNMGKDYESKGKSKTLRQKVRWYSWLYVGN
jgi:ABC-type lipoprotein export system ATPase subunit